MMKKRLYSMCMIFFVIFSLLTGRLMYISLRHGKAYQTMAVAQSIKHMPLQSRRAPICDRYGEAFTEQDTQWLCLTKDGKISSKQEDSVFSFSVKRRAPLLARHLIGYVDIDGRGISGIEREFDEQLKTNICDEIEYMADAAGAPRDDFSVKRDNTSPDSSIRLTLDKKIQAAAELVMDKYIKSGACVVLDVQSFDVLAMVSRPNFENNNIAAYLKSQKGELLNRAVMPYSAGSVFKIAGAAAALVKNPAVCQRSFDCRGLFDLGDGHVFSCNAAGGHGILGLESAFAKSCNCSYYLLGIESGAKSLMSMAEKFGMGQRLLNINIGEYGGNLPKRAAYSMAETLNLSIGQGEILITPLQCAVMAATVANGGIRCDVNIVDKLILSDGSEQDMRNKNLYKAVSEPVANSLGAMMRSCVTSGTAKAANKGEIEIAGKTGSAETGSYIDGKHLVHGWFCGFFPYEKPSYAMAFFSEGGESGAKSCVEPFLELAQKIIEIYPKE